MPTFSIKQFLFVIFSTTASLLLAQTAAIHGKILANGKDAIEYANIGLFSKSDSNLIKAELSNESGEFKFSSLASGEYFIKITSLGIADKLVDKVVLQQGESLQLGIINVEQSAISLKETTVTAKRSLIEVKPDKNNF
jgi:iron complex outermembrane receptor protein